MPTYNEVLNQVKSLAFTDQRRLLEELKNLVESGVEIEGEDEVIPAEEIAESEAAWEEYLGGSDRGISSKELKSKLYAIEIQGEAIVLRPATSQIVSEKQRSPEVTADPLVGLFAGSPDLATKSEEILQQTSKEMPKRNLNRWYGFLPKRVDALEFQLKLRQEWDD